MLTVEFKCYPTPEQEILIERWLEISKAVWNHGLSALEEFDKNYYWYKATEGVNGKEPGNFAPICRLPWEYRPYWLNENGSINLEGKGDIIWVPFSRIYDDRSHWYIKELSRVKVPQASEKKQSWGWKNNEDSMLTGYSCPIPCDWKEPMLHRPGLQQSGGLGQVIKGDNLAERSREFTQEMPYKFRTGVLAGLDTSWQEFTKSRAGIQNGAVRGRPRFKRKRDKTQTVVHPNPKDAIEPKGKNILGGIPSLGKLKVKGLDRRWRNSDGSIPKIATFKLCKYPSGYYVQLTGDLQRSRRIKANSKAVGIDPGLDNYLTLSNGKKYGNPRFYRHAQATLAELQRELAAKLIHRLILWLNHPQRLHKEIREFINISPKKAEELCKVKTEAEGVALIGGMFWQKLKWSLPKSKEQEKLEAKISKLHEKIRRQRSAFNNKISSEIVTNYEFISCENGLQSQNLRKEAKPQEDLEKGGYKKNGKARKSGLAKSLSDAGHGDVIAKIEQKSKRDQRTFKRNPAAYTSQTCPVCCQKMSEMSDPKIKVYQCACGWKQDRDVNAAINDELALLADLLSKGKKKWADLTLVNLEKEMPMKLSKGAEVAKVNRMEFLKVNDTGRKKKRSKKS